MTRLAPFLIFLAVALTIVGGLHFYAWVRLVRDPQLPALWGRLITALLVLMVVNLFGALIASRFLQADLVRPLYFLAFFWMGAGFLLVGLLGAVDTGRAIAHVASWIASRVTGNDPVPLDSERRVFLSRVLAGGVGAAAAGLSAWGVKSALASIQVKPVSVALAKLPEALRGLRLVQISDVHIGPLLRKDWLEKVVAQAQALKPDLIAITGDLVDGSVRELAEHVAPLGKLSAKYGVFFVTGNHEYYSGAESWLRHLPSLGIQPLQNERVQVAPGLEVAGVNDFTARQLGPPHAPDIARTLAGRDPNGAVILLAHQPRAFKEAAKQGADLTLSGHTHAGQMWPATWLVHLAQPFVAGLHKLGEAQLYVNQGTGFWGPPLRVGAPAEITLIELEPGAKVA